MHNRMVVRVMEVVLNSNNIISDCNWISTWGQVALVLYLRFRRLQIPIVREPHCSSNLEVGIAYGFLRALCVRPWWCCVDFVF